MSRGRTIFKQTRAASVLLPVVIAVCLSVMMKCNKLSVDGGFGSETTNGRVSGKVILPGGSPAIGAHAEIRSTDYAAAVPKALAKTWEQADDGLTDSNGCFTFDSLDTGSYSVEINDRSALAVLKQCSISPDRHPVNVGTITMQCYAAVTGEVNIDAAPGAVWYVQVYGLERLAPVDGSGTFTISDLPAGTFRLRIVCSDSAVQPVIIDKVTTMPGATTVVPSVGWRSSRQLALNTTAGGANVAGTVYRFPVLVRLIEGNNFLFNEAKKNGEDVRFRSSGNRMLPYEIERWDSAGGRAELWVLVDTIYGNNSTQYITMQWGNSNARDNSNGAAVFDTANGFAAVWHLCRNSADATFNKNNAQISTALDTTGVIGFCKKFNGADSMKIAGLLGSPSSITLSAWAQLDTTPAGGGGEILSIGDAALIRMDYALGGLGTMGAVHLYSHPTDTAFDNVCSGQFLKRTGWHLITFTVDQGIHNQALYIDGTLSLLETSMNSTIDYSGVGKNTFIGKHGNGKTNFNFYGRIDEVRVCRTAISADYIKLCYRNQKAQDALVVFK